MQKVLVYVLVAGVAGISIAMQELVAKVVTAAAAC
jgi:hypothetical protein